MTEQNQQNDNEYEIIKKICRLSTIDLQYVVDGFQKLLEGIGESIAQSAKTLQELFEENEFDEVSVLSEKEIKKKIKYAKTPMEAKHWNKVLNERQKLKKGGFL